MNAQSHIFGQGEAGAEARILRARLDNIAASLPHTIWANPLWAVFNAAPFCGIFPLVGTVYSPRLSIVVLLQVVNSLIAAMLYRGYRNDPPNAKRWLWRLVAFQAVIGTGWGTMPWLLWVQDNVANHIMIALGMAGILWAYTMSRTIHPMVYFASVVPTVICAAIRFGTSTAGDAGILEYILLITFICTASLALAVKRQLESLLKTRFSNEDLTAELRQAHDQALRKRFEAEAANASKTTFLANMSHELRTPLNAILGFSDMIENQRLGAVENSRYREYAHDIHASGSHLLSIINDILDVAKIESGRMEIEPRPVDPADAVVQAARVVSPRARERRQTLRIEIAPATPWPIADERALRQMVINLATNAVKFTPLGGVIKVRCYRAADGGFELCVEDNGPGIAPDLLERVFTPFNQIDNRYNRQAGGTGLGLSLVRGLAQLHKGHAWVESKRGQGTRAYVHLPLIKEVSSRSQRNQLRAISA